MDNLKLHREVMFQHNTNVKVLNWYKMHKMKGISNNTIQDVP